MQKFQSTVKERTKLYGFHFKSVFFEKLYENYFVFDTFQIILSFSFTQFFSVPHCIVAK